MKPLAPITRIILALAVLALVSGYYLPLWEIQLWAPQYPEGLNMKIWLTHLGGAFDIINGLNHYIGMRQIKQEMFPEFGYMGRVLGFLVLAGLVPVVTGKRRWLQVFVVILFIAAGLGIFDFYRWGHDYGHNLDPKAAISVPGMSYDPPLVGYKSLLNFVAYSGPDTGGWVLIGSGAVATALLVLETLLAGRTGVRMAGGTAILTTFTALILPGCDSGPRALDYGLDECDGCGMILTDRHHGSEIISGKGRIHKFDDLDCMIGFLHKEPAKSNKNGKCFVIDFTESGRFIDVGNAWFVKHERLKSPMGGHVGAFPSEATATAMLKNLGGGGRILRWGDLIEDH